MSLTTIYILLSVCIVALSSGERALADVVQPETKANTDTNDSSERVSQKVFKPEKHWKVLQPDETVPKGLHVRINLQTGKKEAKPPGESDKKPYDKKYTTEKLTMYVKNIKNEADSLNTTKKQTFRDMSAIEKDFEHLHLKPVKSESYTIQELLQKFRSKTSIHEEKQRCLKEMEFLLHQYDVARDFVKMRGVRDLLNALNDTTLQSDAALALGAALQGNPTVQTAALGAEGVHSLLVALREGCGPHCVFSLSSLLRQFPKAQKSFLHEGGADVLSKVFSKAEASQKLKMKIVTLLSDLIVERNQAMQNQQDNSLKRSYSEVDLMPSVIKAGFCEKIPRLLNSRNEDVREKVLNALHVLVNHCKLDKLVPHLESLRSHYHFRMHEESLSVPDEYFEGLFKLADDLVKHITDVNHTHAEL
ncbi:nucleotide exchange factor SIL1-like [Tropilaelaps mercedesae]|uniref:Nucleotide exchange factor SIL1 n=1 Tax=Tropilaelaps mercedesae TaxID=418985 RepID=A0A1V9X6X8_9ACAR|nr:nucleotide exchange factor SIL1-like [Tropilaelaps mercedesae]